VPLFDVPPDAFTPPPKVMSSVVRMRPLPHDQYEINNPRMLAQIVKQAFSRRRKTLRNALKGLADETQIATAGLEPGHRPEQIPVAAWVRLANFLAGEK
jgi:16S rRNA (adenine1518-N6/adenine1519-N6)-dimethyltransferase